MTEKETKRGLRKERTGIVVRAQQEKTIIVSVERRTAHPLYGKVVKQSKRYHVHDEEGKAAVGDVVRISETRPLSKLKRWRLVEILRKAE